MLNNLRHSMKKTCKFLPIGNCYKYQVEDIIHRATCCRAEEGHVEVEEGAHTAREK